LIADLHDAKSQSLVWRRIAQETFSNNGDKNQKMVQSAISKMFKQWPKG
jgi:signal transduction histidine kinase